MKKFIYLHKFFLKESKSFVGKWHEVMPPDPRFNLRFGYYRLSLKQKLYYPIAYIKFMYYSIFDK